MLVKGITNSEIERALAELKPRHCVTCLRQWLSLMAPQSKFCNRFCEETYPATMKSRSWRIQNAEMRKHSKPRGAGYNPDPKKEWKNRATWNKRAVIRES